MANAETSKATSADLKKLLMEETSKMAEAPEVEETEETVEMETEEPEESTKEEPQKEETTEEKPKEKEDLHKIVVEGKEEEIPYDKLKEYAQKGRYLEREMAKLKAEKAKISPQQQQMPQDFSKINEQFVENLQKDTFGTMVQFYQTARQLEKQQEMEHKRLDKEFELEKRELPHFRGVKPIYDEFKELGYERETAWAMAEADFWKDYALKQVERARIDTEKKVKLQKKAEMMPVGEKKTKETTSFPSPDQLKKMSSTEIAKHLKRTKVPGW